FKSLRALGWEVIDLHEAHDLQTCVSTLESALNMASENPQKAIAIHARTIKGYGVKKTADSASGGHGFPLKHPSELKAFLSEIYAGAEVPKVFLDWAAEAEASAAAAKKAPAPAVPEMKVQVGV